MIQRAAASFIDVLADWPVHRVRELVYSRTPADVTRALGRNRLSADDFAALLSPAAASSLEVLARHSSRLTRQRFGHVIQLYVPLYVSNYCTNACVYCGFNCRNQVKRRRLALDMAVREALCLSELGFGHLLLVSGEDRIGVPAGYFEELTARIRGRFPSIGIEVYPMSEAEYARLVCAGVDSLTLYQETYDPVVYARCHPFGGKGDYVTRVRTVEAGARAGMTFLGIGALLGLADWRVDSFYTGLHGHWLHRRYWRQHVSISFPRMRAAAGGVPPAFPVGDAELVQIICAHRLFLPDAGLVMSTRERGAFRDRLALLGITRMSAGSRTMPGGYAAATDSEEQFEVLDHRSLREVMEAMACLGLDPVRKDWDATYHDRTGRQTGLS
ncbi:MAG: 2-iminoacetate synthase ThiH [Kiritimatiellaeota bacterium]|nr:2-iminoacetate synthase ThiH [Kiritimatiellota bacterium]